ncbi:MAG: hypothetical protein L0Y71_18490 [Gemmataceae bacterium]|nr:hypothetical protein [Gemmataceae bacterium]
MLHVRLLAVGGLALAGLALAGTLSAQDKKKPADEVMIVGQIVESDLPDKVRKHPCKVHTLKLVKDKAYQIDLESTEFDPYLRIEDAAGKQLAFDDDGGDKLNSRLRFIPGKDGNYQIIATSFGGGTGAYTLKVRSATANLQAAADGKVHAVGAAGLKIDSRLTKDDPKDRVRVQSNAKVYLVKMTAGKTYKIDMESEDFDSYLRLEDMTGNELAKDDDGGDKFNARITHRAKADGTYRIIATTFTSDEGGPFVLKVREE